MSDESRARALLQEMQARLAESPHAALGIPTHATPADIRSAFLQLTKTFHPARFGRMASDIQKQSNEVFLALRAAHDLLAKPKTTTPSGRPGSTTASPVVARPPTRPFGVPVTPATKPGMPPTAPRAPAPPERQTGALPPIRQTGQTPVLRPSQPVVPQTPAPQPVAARPSSPPGMKFATPSASPATTPRTPAPSASQPMRAAASSSTMRALDPAVAPFLEMLARGEWDRAQAQIDALVTRNPQNPRYAALAAYARGRHALVTGNIRVAQIELNDAVKLDPELELARSAIAELYKPKADKPDKSRK